MNEVVEKVKAFATKAHDGQKRKYTPEPYIVHPIHVMEICAGYNGSIPILSAALLHDVLEDTNVGKKNLKQFLQSIMSEGDAEKTFQLVVELTDVYVKADYLQWNRKKRKQKEALRIEQTSADSQTIKYADIIDNCKEIAQYDEEFGPEFLWECKMLLQKINKGNEELYGKAEKIVREGLEQARRGKEKT